MEGGEEKKGRGRRRTRLSLETNGRLCCQALLMLQKNGNRSTPALLGRAAVVSLISNYFASCGDMCGCINLRRLIDFFALHHTQVAKLLKLVVSATSGSMVAETTCRRQHRRPLHPLSVVTPLLSVFITKTPAVVI